MKLASLVFALLICGSLRAYAVESGQTSSEYTTPQQVKDQFTSVEIDYQKKMFTVMNTTPTSADLNEQNIVIYSTGNTANMFFKYNGKTFVFLGTRFN